MRKRSIALTLATVFAVAYTVYLFCYFVGGTVSADGAAEAIGGAIATALVTPHAITFLIGAIFGCIGLFLRKTWAALVAAILYSAATLMFLVYFMFGVPILVLGFVGYANQKKINTKLAENN